MAFQRRLSDHQLIAARWEYEATSISERNLAAKYGLSRSAIHGWIVKQGWARAEVLRSYIMPARRGNTNFNATSAPPSKQSNIRN